MSLSIALNTALSGLNVNQQALTVLSQNIANANTQGYSKQQVNQQAVYIDGQGSGVDLETVTRKVDQYLTQAVQQQNSVVGQTSVVSDYNTQIQQLLGQPGSSNSLDSYVTDFFNNVQALAQTPQDATLQQTVVNSGVTLASQSQQLAQGLQGLQYQSDQDVASAVNQINADLKNLQQTNTAIVNGTVLGQSVAGLEDTRDGIVNDLSQYMPIHTYLRDNGAISVSTSGGVSLLDDNLYQLNYQPVDSAGSFNSNASLSALTVQRLDDNGAPVGSPVQLVSGGPPSQVTSGLTSGKLAGLLNVRDQEIPGIMSQLDTLASTLSDQVNRIQNAGSGFPGANSYTGTRAVNAQDYSQWAGSVRIAVLGQDGASVASPYTDETSVTPLTLNLSTLNTAQGTGNPSTQDIINAINQYYTPATKAEVGNLNNIQLASDSANLPGAPAQLNFDLNVSNLSSTASNLYVTGVTVKDSTGTDITSVSSTIPSIALSPTATYVTTAGSNTVTITANNTLKNGDTVYLSTPPGNVDGIPANDLGGFYTVSNVTNGSFQITVADSATNGGTYAALNQTALPPYANAPAGSQTRTAGDGIISADLSANPNSAYYDVTVNVASISAGGTPTSSQITYRINNQQSNLLNAQFSAIALNGSGTLVSPTSSQPLATAILVDANGNELPKVNGQYVTNQQGYLEIKATDPTDVIAIDSLNSSQQGQPNNNPSQPGTDRGFSYYFELNNFFQSNKPTATGDTVAGSAAALQVEQRLQDDPSLISTGSLTPTPSSVTPGAPPSYAYERDAGDNSIITQLAALGSSTVSFAAAGMSATKQSLNGYANQIIGTASTNAATATTTQTNAQTLLTGYTQQASSVSGVNLDTELANTIIYQNAYAASARVITVAGAMFNTLLQAFGT